MDQLEQLLAGMRYGVFRIEVDPLQKQKVRLSTTVTRGEGLRWRRVRRGGVQRKVLSDGRGMDAVDQVDSVQRNVWFRTDTSLEKLRKSGTSKWGIAMSGIGKRN